MIMPYIHPQTNDVRVTAWQIHRGDGQVASKEHGMLIS
jgi:hypothetical protein